jgi:hypothetical protein
MARIKMINGIPHFYCLACSSLHVLDTRFRFNYSMNLPTFRGLIKVTVGPFKPGHVHAGKTLECHFTITAGVITYAETSTHDQAGKVLGLPDFDEIQAMLQAQAAARRDLAARAPAALTPD